MYLNSIIQYQYALFRLEFRIFRSNKYITLLVGIYFLFLLRYRSKTHTHYFIKQKNNNKINFTYRHHK